MDWPTEEAQVRKKLREEEDQRLQQELAQEEAQLEREKATKLEELEARIQASLKAFNAVEDAKDKALEEKQEKELEDLRLQHQQEREKRNSEGGKALQVRHVNHDQERERTANAFEFKNKELHIRFEKEKEALKAKREADDSAWGMKLVKIMMESPMKPAGEQASSQTPAFSPGPVGPSGTPTQPRDRSASLVSPGHPPGSSQGSGRRSPARNGPPIYQNTGRRHSPGRDTSPARRGRWDDRDYEQYGPRRRSPHRGSSYYNHSPSTYRGRDRDGYYRSPSPDRRYPPRRGYVLNPSKTFAPSGNTGTTDNQLASSSRKRGRADDSPDTLSRDMSNGLPPNVPTAPRKFPRLSEPRSMTQSRTPTSHEPTNVNEVPLAPRAPGETRGSSFQLTNKAPPSQSKYFNEPARSGSQPPNKPLFQANSQASGIYNKSMPLKEHELKIVRGHLGLPLHGGDYPVAADSGRRPLGRRVGPNAPATGPAVPHNTHYPVKRVRYIQENGELYEWIDGITEPKVKAELRLIGNTFRPYRIGKDLAMPSEWTIRESTVAKLEYWTKWGVMRVVKLKLEDVGPRELWMEFDEPKTEVLARFVKRIKDIGWYLYKVYPEVQPDTDVNPIMTALQPRTEPEEPLFVPELNPEPPQPLEPSPDSLVEVKQEPSPDAELK